LYGSQPVRECSRHVRDDPGFRAGLVTAPEPELVDAIDDRFVACEEVERLVVRVRLVAGRVVPARGRRDPVAAEV